MCYHNVEVNQVSEGVGQENLKQKRQRAEVSQRRLAKHLRKSRGWVQRIEEAPVQTVWLADAFAYTQALEACAKEPKPKRGRPKKSEEGKEP